MFSPYVLVSIKYICADVKFGIKQEIGGIELILEFIICIVVSWHVDLQRKDLVTKDIRFYIILSLSVIVSRTIAAHQKTRKCDSLATLNDDDCLRLSSCY